MLKSFTVTCLFFTMVAAAQDPSPQAAKFEPREEPGYTKSIKEKLSKKKDALVKKHDVQVTYDSVKAAETKKKFLAEELTEYPEQFDKIGNTKAAWAADARKGLEAHARLRITFVNLANSFTRPEALEQQEALAAAIKKGCDDALVVYVHNRFDILQKQKPGQKLSLASVKKTADTLLASKYSDVVKMESLWLMMMDCLLSSDRLERNEASKVWLPKLLPIMKSVAASKTHYGDRMIIYYMTAYSQILRATTTDITDDFNRLSSPAKAVGSAYLNDVLKGVYLVQSAWQARGSGVADSVTEDGMRKFKEKLTEAGEVLENAHKAEPTRGDVQDLMIRVCTGLKIDEQKTFEWFHLAIHQKPYNYLSVISMLEYMSPKWHGSEEALQGLHWSIIKETKGESDLGYTALNHHMAHIGAYTRKYEITDNTGISLRDNNVWHMLATSYENDLKAEPANAFKRTRYAVNAVHGGRGATALNQFDILGDKYDRSFFKTPEDYDNFKLFAESAYDKSKEKKRK